MARMIYILNGPNLNLLGKREPHIYGHETLEDVERRCKALLPEGFDLSLRQSNHEGQLIDWIHEAREAACGIVLNPGAYTHTSIALHDALKAVDCPIYEVHLSNIFARETFRHHSYISALAKGVICGLGWQGYIVAIDAINTTVKD